MNKDKFFKIYTGDYSKDGYDSGINDSKNEKPKSGFKVLKAVHPVNYAWKFKNSYDSYSKNYKKGYLDGLRVNHDIYSSNQAKGVNMSNDSFSNHLRMISEVRHNLISLKRYITEKRDEYKRQIDVASNAGFANEIVEQLNEKYNLFSQKIDNLTSLLERHDANIQEQEDDIQGMIASSQQS